MGRAIRTGEVCFENVPPGVDFLIHMVRRWGFTMDDAILLRQDRRSYLCVPLKNPHTGDVVGAVYCDSAREGELGPDIAEKVRRNTVDWHRDILI